uniref:Uncharacterized protein n=1 Tax=Anguilla anguilla TaxID=7936 RepID=A0A0E9S2U7_ANGAN
MFLNSREMSRHALLSRKKEIRVFVHQNNNSTHKVIVVINIPVSP